MSGRHVSEATVLLTCPGERLGGLKSVSGAAGRSLVLSHSSLARPWHVTRTGVHASRSLPLLPGRAWPVPCSLALPQGPDLSLNPWLCGKMAAVGHQLTQHRTCPVRALPRTEWRLQRTCQ